MEADLPWQMKPIYGLAGLSLSGTLSALLVILVLSIYIRKTRASQKALEASKLQTENLAKTKELFMANVSHEIRTPMNAISGFVDQLVKKPLEEALQPLSILLNLLPITW